MNWDQPIESDTKRPWICLNCLKVRKSRRDPCKCGGKLVIRAGNESGGLVREKTYGFECNKT